MPVAERINALIESSSWVRRMFEDGARRKAEYGSENVYDFSLGNPNLEPPDRLRAILKELIDDDSAGMHGYMPNAGFIKTREAIGAYLSGMSQFSFDALFIARRMASFLSPIVLPPY